VRAFLVAALLAGVSIACGSSSPSTPSVPSIAGNWSGSVASTYVGNGTITFSLAQNGTTVSGQWATTFPGQPPNGGSASGSVSGSTLTVRLTPGSPGLCGFNTTATVNDTSMSGTYAAYNCSVPDAGTFTVTKH